MTNTTTDIRVNSILESIISNLTQLKSIIGKGNGVSTNATKASENTYAVEDDNSPYAPTFYRYIRPINPTTGEYSSQQGVTLRINLNYQKRQIKFKYAICNHGPGETSFDKKMGKMITTRRKILTIPMWENEGPLLGCDLTAFIVNAIENKEVDIPPGDRRHILSQYATSMKTPTSNSNKYRKTNGVPEKSVQPVSKFKWNFQGTKHTQDHVCCGKCN